MDSSENGGRDPLSDTNPQSESKKSCNWCWQLLGRHRQTELVTQLHLNQPPLFSFG